MPLYDHFHGSLHKKRHWESFHSTWTTFIARQLNKGALPAGYLAEPCVTLGVSVEVDIATYDEEPDDGSKTPQSPWKPPGPTASSPVDLAGLDVVEVRVYDDEATRTLVAAVEIVSPANKDRRSHRRAFVTKCAAYLQQEVSLIVVDVVTNRSKNLFKELAEFLELDAATCDLVAGPPYAVACRTARRRKRTRLEVWSEPLAVGQNLPVLPLWLTRAIAVPLNLEASYFLACDTLSIPA